jgi:hypothetical protein
MALRALTLGLAVATATAAGCRDPRAWPFDDATVWNSPLGSGAEFVPAALFAPPSAPDNVFSDDDYFVVSAAADPMIPWRNQGHWNATPNCEVFPWAPIVGSVHWPAGLTINQSGNNALALLQPDNDTLVLTQPAYRCTPDAPLLSLYDAWHGNGSLRGNGNWGGHGGSALNAIGGSLRVGELLPSSPQPPQHVLKLQLWAAQYYYGPAAGANKSTCFRWPALCCDGYSDDPTLYGGGNPLLTPGALLALPPAAGP